MYSPVYHTYFIESFNNIRNKKFKENLCKKVNDILETVSLYGDESFKNLRKPLHQYKRVHVINLLSYYLKLIMIRKLFILENMTIMIRFISK